ECFTIKDLAIDGRDLIALGIKPGKDIGIILNKLLDKVIENPNLNNKEVLINMIK
ncbi:MAG: polynucleotide adenylyltransferase, partial [Clostridium sp.]|nr:polynucleotide adenylyltransferase [Clostridium sp.]